MTAIRRTSVLLIPWLLVSVAIPAAAAKFSSRAPGTPILIEIDHETGIRNPAGSIAAREGQRIKIVVKNTRTDCFDLKQREERIRGGNEDLGFDPNRRDTVTWEFDFDPAFNYIIEAKLKPNADSGCREILNEQSWPITFKTLGWTLAFAGAFTGDNLTDPVVFLEPGKNPADATQQGFLVRVKNGAEDNYKLGTAAIIHLVHNDPELGRIPWLGDTKWAPVSFGLGINQGSDVRYFVGTSLQFSDQLYLSAGKVFGSVKRLPDALAPGGFTADSNALANRPSRTDDGWFAGISYSFLGSSARAGFSQKFTTSPPGNPTVQTGTQQGQSGQGGTGGELKLTFKKGDAFEAPQGGKLELAEGKSLELKIQLTGSSTVAIPFKIVRTPGTAKEGEREDFTVAVSSQPKVDTSQPELTFTITANQDDEAQGDRKFTLSIDDLPSAVKMNPRQFEVTIKDDDGAS